LIFLFFSAVILPAVTSCRKITPTVVPEESSAGVQRGLPPDIRKINAYLFAGIWTHSQYDQNWIQYYAFATFGDPAMNLTRSYDQYQFDSSLHRESLGNVKVGEVSFNGKAIISQTLGVSKIGYERVGPMDADKAVWSVEGVAGYQGSTTDLSWGFPVINYSVALASYVQGTDLMIDLKGFISNYDSVIITVKGTEPFAVRKGIVFPADHIGFASDELKVHTTLDECIITYYAFNYGHSTVKNKLQVYELANKFVCYTKIVRNN
jgi:hypothetical protein